MQNKLTSEDLSVIAVFWLVLSNLGFIVQDLDLSQPGYIQHQGPHTIYTFMVLLRDDMEFPESEFCRLLDEYCKISPVKPHCYSVEQYPAHQCLYMNAAGTKTVPLKNFSSVYVSVFI